MTYGRPYCRPCGTKGDRNPNWRGDKSGEAAGHARARRLMVEYAGKPCQDCGDALGVEVHHQDGNELNNEGSNLFWLCRRCHMVRDGRLGTLTAGAAAAGVKGGYAKAAAMKGEIDAAG